MWMQSVRKFHTESWWKLKPQAYLTGLWRCEKFTKKCLRGEILPCKFLDPFFVCVPKIGLFSTGRMKGVGCWFHARNIRCTVQLSPWWVAASCTTTCMKRSFSELMFINSCVGVVVLRKRWLGESRRLVQNGTISLCRCCVEDVLVPTQICQIPQKFVCWL